MMCADPAVVGVGESLINKYIYIYIYPIHQKLLRVKLVFLLVGEMPSFCVDEETKILL